MFPGRLCFCAVCTVKEGRAAKIGVMEVVDIHTAYDRPFAAKLEQAWCGEAKGGFEADSGNDQKLDGSFDQPELGPAERNLSAHAQSWGIDKPPTAMFDIAPKFSVWACQLSPASSPISLTR